MSLGDKTTDPTQPVGGLGRRVRVWVGSAHFLHPSKGCGDCGRIHIYRSGLPNHAFRLEPPAGLRVQPSEGIARFLTSSPGG